MVDVRPNNEIRKKDQSQRGIFSKFVSGLSADNQKGFLNSLSEAEKVNFSSSKEEFRYIMGRDAEVPFPKAKPDYEKDVRFSNIKLERIKERFDEYKKMFPKNKSIAGLENMMNNNSSPSPGFKSIGDLKAMSQPVINITISFGQLKNKAKGVPS